MVFPGGVQALTGHSIPLGRVCRSLLGVALLRKLKKWAVFLGVAWLDRIKAAATGWRAAELGQKVGQERQIACFRAAFAHLCRQLGCDFHGNAVRLRQELATSRHDLAPCNERGRRQMRCRGRVQGNYGTAAACMTVGAKGAVSQVDNIGFSGSGHR